MQNDKIPFQVPLIRQTHSPANHTHRRRRFTRLARSLGDIVRTKIDHDRTRNERESLLRQAGQFVTEILPSASWLLQWLAATKWCFAREQSTQENMKQKKLQRRHQRNVGKIRVKKRRAVAVG